MRDFDPVYLQELSARIYDQNKAMGWWDDPDRCIYTCMQLIITEIAEATEGERKGLMDDHLPHRKMGEVELADAMIRALDLGGRFVWGVFPISNYNHVWIQPMHNAGKIHLGLCHGVIDLATAYFAANKDEEYYYNVLLIGIHTAAEYLGHYELYDAIEEKLEYNKTRPDHRRENRQLEGGKKF